jgi:hypothetical protein
MSKNLGVSLDYILNEMSYENLIMYGYAIPSYEPKSKEEKDWDDRLDANNPNNFNHSNEEEEYVR